MTSISLFVLAIALTTGQQALAFEPAGLGSLNTLTSLHGRNPITRPFGSAMNTLGSAARLGAMHAVNHQMGGTYSGGYPGSAEMTSGLGRAITGGAIAAGAAGAAAAAAGAQAMGAAPLVAGTAAGSAAAAMGASPSAAAATAAGASAASGGEPMTTALAAAGAANQARLRNAAHLMAGSSSLGRGMMAGELAAASGIQEAAAINEASKVGNAIATGTAAASAAAVGAAAAGAGAAGAAEAASAAGAVAGAISAANTAHIPNQAAVDAVIGATSVNALGRIALASEAVNNAKTEAALAGAEMYAHGNNNARSASMAANAYRQAKLASARDRVNIAGTIQNSARISDAAIATHDAATKAEDSLLGSEAAVDSAATVLDSDAAYIPPVTSSLLRSLPYGRLGIRNIIPKPLTYPSVLLPDVWLNGVPVSYLNVPLRGLPYGIGSTAFTNQLGLSGARLATGQLVTHQPFNANNGMLINELVMDPAGAFVAGGLPALARSSVLPVLANGQLEAQDEVTRANMLNLQQLSGTGMAATYTGYGRMNPVPMLTGSVTEANLLPTTTIGTTYPIGSALVIEPRDSFFQDYIDNASSRKNFDERQQ